LVEIRKFHLKHS